MAAMSRKASSASNRHGKHGSSAHPSNSSSGRVSEPSLSDPDTEDMSSSDEFWVEDLVWPDPCKRFAESSGVKPGVLTAVHKHFRGTQKGVEGGQMGVSNRCTSAKVIRMVPRPTCLPWNVLVVHSDPPTVDEDDVEEFLVHDPLFVEFFNAFLSLPSFPEPICFNVETGGFEVVSDGKRRLAQQIKEAVRSQNITAKMYRVVRNHAFSNIPLIPIEDTQQGPEAVKIDTSFEVTALNKDQGIYWIKAERLPIFLESDYYFQYRLAKIISQARIFNEKGEFIIMKIDFTTRPKKKKVSVEVPPPNLEETIMKEMFVSFGDVRGAAKEDWFNLAKAELRAEPPFTPLGVKSSSAETPALGVSAEQGGTKSKTPVAATTPVLPASARPADDIKSMKKSSVFHSHFFGVYAPGLIGPKDVEPPTIDRESVEQHMLESAAKPFTPRPNERMFKSTDMVRKKVCPDPKADEYMIPSGPTIYVQPKQDNSNFDAESGIGDMEEKEDDFEKRMNEQPIIDQIYHDGSWEQDGGTIALKSLDELGSVIVGAILKKTVAGMLGTDETKVIADPVISAIYPSQDLTCISVSDLDLCAVVPERHGTYMSSDLRSSQGKAADTSAGGGTRSAPGSAPGSVGGGTPAQSAAPVSGDKKHKDKSGEVAGPGGANLQLPRTAPSETTTGSMASSVVPSKDPPHIKWDKPMKKPAEEESDADSLLDSDEDFEERDSHFRRNKNKWHSLSSWKGIMAFKEFLSGTSGEKYWQLWIDIDKGRLIHSEEDKQRYIMYMRNSYYRKGTPFELSAEDKKKLGLENLSSWCPEYLSQIHAKVLEPLVLYWAPRYLLHNLMRAHPEKYKEYNEMRACERQRESDPFPQTAPLLPLRPKSCCPRIRHGRQLEGKPSPPISFEPKPPTHGTSPMVGNHRVYGEDTIRRLANTPSAKFLGLKAPPSTRPSTAAGSIPGTKPSTGRRASMSAATKISGSGRRLSTHNSTMIVEPAPSEHGNGPPATSLGLHPSASQMARGSFVTAGGGGLHSEDVYVGKMSGMQADPSSSSQQRSHHSSSGNVGGKKHKRPCLTRNLDHILGDPKAADRPSTAYPSLGAVKKPKDLLTPMLKIVDSKDARSKRIRSAPAPELEKASNVSTFYRQDSQSSSRKCPTDQLTSGDDVTGVGDAADVEGGGATSGEAGPYPVVAIQDCDFLGSTRLEFLLQALHHENDAGRSLRKYIEKSGKQDWLNNLDFWEKVQQYSKLFYKDKLDLFLISWQAKAICAEYIVEGAEKHIGVSESVELQVLERLSPAYESLFDEAEEHALKRLFEAFQLYLGQDVKTYCKVERSAITRRLETKNTYILNLQKKGIIKEGPLTPDDPMAGYVDPVCDESILEKIPERFRDWTLDKLLHNRIELEHFRRFLAENYAEVDLKCWMDIETWRRTPHEEDKKRDQRARDIKKNYLNRKYFFGPSSPAGKEGQNKVMEVGGGWGKFLEDKPHSRSILESQKYVRERLEKKHLAWFLASKEFQERQSPKLSVSDSADDVVTQKRKRTAAVLKVLRVQEERFYTMIGRKPPLQPRVSHLVLPPITGKGRKPRFGSGYIAGEDGDSLSGRGSTTASSRFRSSGMSSDVLDSDMHSSVVGSSVDVMATLGKQKKVDASSPTSSGDTTGLLESRWVTSAKEINCFRQALKNPLTCELLRQYVSLQGENLENDVLFWLEVQKYREMHHTHTEDTMLNQKIGAIINCFIDSSIPPTLQIDIPQDMADRILEHKHERGPYLFREAQLATFRILLQHWQPFVEFRNNMVTNERAMKTLERHRIIARRKEQEYREEMEAQRERDRLQRIEDEMFGTQDAIDDEERGGKYGFSYSAYLQEMLNERSKDTQTPRGIPEFPEQAVEERPGYVDDPDASDIKNYTDKDFVIYKEFLQKHADAATERAAAAAMQAVYASRMITTARQMRASSESVNREGGSMSSDGRASSNYQIGSTGGQQSHGETSSPDQRSSKQSFSKLPGK